MDWKLYEGKKVKLILVDGGYYQGQITDIDETKYPRLIWITIKDKFGKNVTFVNTQILKIEEIINGN